jgi:hypothetical protein
MDYKMREIYVDFTIKLGWYESWMIWKSLSEIMFGPKD